MLDNWLRVPNKEHKAEETNPEEITDSEAESLESPEESEEMGENVKHEYSLLDLENLDGHKNSTEIEVSEHAVFDSGTTMAYFSEELMDKIQKVYLDDWITISSKVFKIKISISLKANIKGQHFICDRMDIILDIY